MGISLYLVMQKINRIDKLYIFNLLVNAFWPVLFFGFKLRLLAFIWLVFLVILTIALIIRFYKIDQKTIFLLVPYLIWLIFAGYLNLAVYLLNN